VDAGVIAPLDPPRPSLAVLLYIGGEKAAAAMVSSPMIDLDSSCVSSTHGVLTCTNTMLARTPPIYAAHSLVKITYRV
jgi:hypothetical protein